LIAILLHFSLDQLMRITILGLFFLPLLKKAKTKIFNGLQKYYFPKIGIRMDILVTYRRMV